MCSMGDQLNQTGSKLVVAGIWSHSDCFSFSDSKIVFSPSLKDVNV